VANYAAEGTVLEKVRVSENETLRRLTGLLARAAKPNTLLLVEPEIANRSEEMA
jgi:hypothetical protein